MHSSLDTEDLYGTPSTGASLEAPAAPVRGRDDNAQQQRAPVKHDAGQHKPGPQPQHHQQQAAPFILAKLEELSDALVDLKKTCSAHAERSRKSVEALAVIVDESSQNCRPAKNASLASVFICGLVFIIIVIVLVKATRGGASQKLGTPMIVAPSASQQFVPIPSQVLPTQLPQPTTFLA